jgi:hypothetical protein
LHTYHRSTKDTSRVRDIAASLGVTERSAYGIVADLAEAGYIVKQKDGRRNRYQIQAHLPLPEPTRRNAPSAKSRPSWPEPAPGRGRRWADAPGAATDQARCHRKPAAS